jgi:hypothetical protein
MFGRVVKGYDKSRKNVDIPTELYAAFRNNTSSDTNI